MAEFSKAIDTVLRNEGGYVNDPKDHGGETNFGISKRSFPNEDIRRLTRERAVAIYRTQFWGKYPLLGQLQSQAVATKVLDLMVNMGPSRAIRILQRAINAANQACVVGEDGRLGPTTVAAANALEAEQLLGEVRNSAARRYCEIVKHDPSQSRFLRTWLLRAYDRPYSKSEPTPMCPPE